MGFQINLGTVHFRNIEIKELQGANKNLPVKDGPAVLDPFQANSVWVSTDGLKTLTVIDRKGEKFRATFRVSPNIDRNVSGMVKDGKIAWLAKDIQAAKGNAGWDNFGTLAKDKDGYLLDFVYRQPGSTVDAGKFQLRLKPGM